MQDDLEKRFHKRMLEIYEACVRECDYRPTYFLRMVQEGGGFQAARSLIHKAQVSEGFTTLWEKGRLDLSVEAAILQEPWSDLFTAEELGIARRRLRQMGYRT